MKVEEVLKGTHQSYLSADFLSTDFFNKRIPLVISGIDESSIEAVKGKLLDVYGDVEVHCITKDGEQIKRVVELCDTKDGEQRKKASELCDTKDVSQIIVDGCAVTECKRFDFADFVQIMRRLRAKDGCEWDRAQTHESIRINLIEEAYELVEAIDCKDADMMTEECGDVLMQAIFHTEIARENGEFGYGEMLTNLCRKLIDRHTHIFGKNHAQNAEEALVFWNEAKKKEKKYKSSADAMDRVPKNLPALLYVDKLLKYAKKSGFYVDDKDSALDKVREEALELKEADDSHRTEEAGDLLLAATKAVRIFGVEPEMALKEAGYKYLRRFTALENLARAQGKEMTDFTLDELDKLWKQVKAEEN